MARRRIDMHEALQVIPSSDGDNPFRDMLELIAQTALEVEMSSSPGSGVLREKRGRDRRVSGTRPRVFTSRVGDLELLIPQDRDGTFSPTLFECFGAMSKKRSRSR